jgi:cytochrome c biogenesis protein CcmG, thiol:disulfide interchange protein DsbE
LKRKLITALVLAALLVCLVALFVDSNNWQGEHSLRGRPGKDLHFTADGKPEQLSDFRGKVVILNFWATWCQPCVDETPSLIGLQKRIAPLGGTVLGVSLDEDQKAYLDFLKAYQVDFPTYRDPSKQSARDFGTSKYPETYIINRQGFIERKIVGPQDWMSPQMVAYVDSVLNGR